MNSDYRQKVRTIIQQNCGQSSSVQAIWGHIESLMGTVTLDKELLIQKIEEVLSEQTSDDKNVLKRVLETVINVFGMNVIPKGICDRIGVDSIQQEQQLLSLDEAQARNIAPIITNAISDLETSSTMHAQRAEQLEKLLNAANCTVDSLRQERDQLLKAQDRRDKDLLRSIQRVLAQHPEMKPAGDDESDALLLYLEDLQLTWSWDDAENPDDFTTYVISDESQVGVRMPCIYRNDAPVQKGLKYVLNN